MLLGTQVLVEERIYVAFLRKQGKENSKKIFKNSAQSRFSSAQHTKNQRRTEPDKIKPPSNFQDGNCFKNNVSINKHFITLCAHFSETQLGIWFYTVKPNCFKARPSELHGTAQFSTVRYWFYKLCRAELIKILRICLENGSAQLIIMGLNRYVMVLWKYYLRMSHYKLRNFKSMPSIQDIWRKFYYWNCRSFKNVAALSY